MPPPSKSGLPPNRRAEYAVLLAGLVTGIGFFFFYYRHNLTLAHYDAKAHLVVARRIIDSLEPGYSQMGVEWLPLTHLVYLPFVAFESQYRSGLIPSLISVCCFALSGWLTYRIAVRLSGSVEAGLFAAVVLLANPNLQYLQSCPLTEPLYMLLFLLAIDSLMAWRESGRSTLPWIPATWSVLGALCRYEGWIVFSGILLLLAHDWWTKYILRRKAVQAAAVYFMVFFIPIAAHFGYIYLRLGDSFFHKVAEGYASPYVTYKRPFLSLLYHFGELSQMAATLPLLLAAIGLLLFALQCGERRFRAPLILLWLPSIINIMALYWGMIYRLRYSVLLLPAVAISGGLVVATEKAKSRAFILLAAIAMASPWICWFWSQIGWNQQLMPGPGILSMPAAALVLFIVARARQQYTWALVFICALAMQLPLLARENRPILDETLEHEFMEPERRAVIQYLRRHYDGRRIMIDMSKQAPLIFDSGLPVNEFVYNDGRGLLWRQALQNPERNVGWLCVESGDAISERMQVDPHWAAGYSLALKTELFSVYRLKH